MDISEYPCESLTFSGLGATGRTPQAAAERLAASLNTWVAANGGRRLLQITPLPLPAGGEPGLAVLLVHTAGSELTGELAEQVADAMDDALEMAMSEEREVQATGGGGARRIGRG